MRYFHVAGFGPHTAPPAATRPPPLRAREHLQFDHQRNLEQALAAAPLKPMPLIVLQSDEPYDLTPYVEDGTLPMTDEEAEQFRKLLYQAW